MPTAPNRVAFGRVHPQRCLTRAVPALLAADQLQVGTAEGAARLGTHQLLPCSIPHRELIPNTLQGTAAQDPVPVLGLLYFTTHSLKFTFLKDLRLLLPRIFSS